MLRIFELFKEDLAHAPGNASTVATICAAYPQHQVAFYAFERHKAAVEAQLGAKRPANLRTTSLGEPPAELPGWAPWRRALYLARLLRRVTAADARAAGELWFVLFGHGTVVRAVRWLLRLRPRIKAQYLVHGDVNEVVGWRSRNPLHRHFDMRACLASTDLARESWLVLEPHIKANLVADLKLPEAAVQVLDYQIDPDEGDKVPDLELTSPVRFCALGLQTAPKGYPVYQSVAAKLSGPLAGRAQFHICGVLHASVAALDRSGLILDVDSSGLIDRDTFLGLVADKHYIVLAFQGPWYRLSLSGTLYDALNFRRPVVALRTQSTERMFARFGDIGHLCDSVEQMQQEIRRIAEAPDAARYARQRENLRTARAQFTPAAVVGIYRRLVDRLGMDAKWLAAGR